MKRNLPFFVPFVAILVFASHASAMHHPALGRFIQRDPGPGGAMRVGAGGPATSGSFAQGDPTGQYADGMNLYQYVGSNPVVFVDPQGLARLQYSYIGIWVSDGKNNNDYKNNHAETLFLENDVEDLLWAYGINAWRTGKNMPKDRMYNWNVKVTDTGILWDTHYDYQDMEETREWRFAGQSSRKSAYYGNADDIIIFVPGNIGWDGKIEPTWIAGHQPSYHVVAVSRAKYMGLGAQKKAPAIAHEVLHHFLEAIDPGGADPGHDTQGVMRLAGPHEGQTKLGCKTVEALKKKGVTDADIDQSKVIK